MWSTLYSFKSFFDDMFSCLSQNLNRNVIRNHILLDQCSKKLILCLRCCRKSYLDHFKSNIYEELEKLQFFIQAHWFDQCLVSIPQIHTAPDRCFINRIFFYPVITWLWRHKISLFVFFPVFHSRTLLIFHQFSCSFLSSPIVS